MMIAVAIALNAIGWTLCIFVGEQYPILASVNAACIGFNVAVLACER